MKGIRDKPNCFPTKGDDVTMEEDGDSDEITDEKEVKLYSQGCEVCMYIIVWILQWINPLQGTLLVLRSICDKNERIRIQVMNVSWDLLIQDECYNAIKHT